MYHIKVSSSHVSLHLFSSQFMRKREGVCLYTYGLTYTWRHVTEDTMSTVWVILLFLKNTHLFIMLQCTILINIYLSYLFIIHKKYLISFYQSYNAMLTLL